jgi:hypothetical protein
MIELIENGLAEVPKVAAARRNLVEALREAKLGSQMRELDLLTRGPLPLK